MNDNVELSEVDKLRISALERMGRAADCITSKSYSVAANNLRIAVRHLESIVRHELEQDDE